MLQEALPWEGESAPAAAAGFIYIYYSMPSVSLTHEFLAAVSLAACLCLSVCVPIKASVYSHEWAVYRARCAWTGRIGVLILDSDVP